MVKHSLLLILMSAMRHMNGECVLLKCALVGSRSSPFPSPSPNASPMLCNHDSSFIFSFFLPSATPHASPFHMGTEHFAVEASSVSTIKSSAFS